MRTQRIVLALAAVDRRHGAVAPASSQEYRGTWEQQMACTPDVWRLCSDQIPDVSRIVAACGRIRRNCRTVAARCSNRAPKRSRPTGAPTPRAPQQAAPRGRAPQQAAAAAGAAACRSPGPISRKTNKPAASGAGLIWQTSTHSADGEFRHPLRRDLDRAVGRAGGRHHHVKRLQRDVAIDRQRRLQSERTDAADLVAGDFGDLFEAEHFRLSPEQRLHLLVVHPRGAGGHDQHHALADPQAQRFGDPRRLDAIGFGGQRHGRGTHLGFDHGDIGRLLREEGADRFDDSCFRTLWQKPGREVRRAPWMR